MRPTTERSDYPGVLALLHDYVDGLWRCDVEQLARVFAPGAIYATPKPDGLLRLSMDEYLPQVAERVPPAEAGTPFDYTVESVAFAGPDVALARVSSSLFAHDYTDFLSLVRVEGAWRIQAKVFHAEPQTPEEL